MNLVIGIIIAIIIVAGVIGFILGLSWCIGFVVGKIKNVFGRGDLYWDNAIDGAMCLMIFLSISLLALFIFVLGSSIAGGIK